ncbi:HAUS augmin-like complex subunit 7 [Phalacrocorax carbo]|uniref:HAUS augmin-like complex subunit 7 n=1 Tax=Phalacrocorax carbo TaxID=9209 RepID=UPI00311A0429
MAAAAAAAAVLERLEALHCPPLAPWLPLGPAEALRLLCTPSARRLALLEWACARVHPPSAARLDALRSGPKDDRLQELAELGARLMLCRADDVALVEGTAPPEQQLEFIRDLLDAAPPPGEESGDPPKSRHTVLHRTDCFLQELLETPEGLAALSPPSPPPLPTFEHWGSPPGGSQPPGATPPPPGDPRPSGQELAAALGAVRRQLELLEAQSPELGGSPGPAPPVLPALGVAGRDLAALATAFGAMELRDPWGKGEPPVLAPCGPLAPPVQQSLQQLMQSLGAVTQMDDTAAEVARLAGGAWRQAMETQVAALQQRFRDVPRPRGPPRTDTPPPPPPRGSLLGERGGGGRVDSGCPPPPPRVDFGGGAPNNWIKEVESDANAAN